MGFNLHLSRTHDRNFGSLFPCPECQRRGTDGILIRSKDNWVSHVEKRHARGGIPGAVITGGASGSRKRKSEALETWPRVKVGRTLMDSLYDSTSNGEETLLESEQGWG